MSLDKLGQPSHGCLRENTVRSHDGISTTTNDITSFHHYTVE